MKLREKLSLNPAITRRSGKHVHVSAGKGARVPHCAAPSAALTFSVKGVYGRDVCYVSYYLRLRLMMSVSFLLKFKKGWQYDFAAWQIHRREDDCD